MGLFCLEGHCAKNIASYPKKGSANLKMYRYYKIFFLWIVSYYEIFFLRIIHSCISMERRRGWEFSDRIDFNVIIIHTWGGGLSSNLKERNCEIILQVSTMVLQQNWFYTPATATKTYGPTLKVHFSLFHFECLKNVPFQRSGQCSISIPPENLKMPQVFWRFQEV